MFDAIAILGFGMMPTPGVIIDGWGASWRRA